MWSVVGEECFQYVGDGDRYGIANTVAVGFGDIEVVEGFGELGGLSVHLAEHFQAFGGVVMDGGRFGEVDDAPVVGVGFLDDKYFHGVLVCGGMLRMGVIFSCGRFVIPCGVHDTVSFLLGSGLVISVCGRCGRP